MSSDHVAEGPSLAEIGPISALVPELVMGHRGLAFTLMRRIGISPGQERLLSKLWASEPLPQAVLVREMGIEAPTVTKMLARMEKAGFVERRRSDADRRVWLVSLTEEGRALREPVARIWAELERRTVGDMPEADRQAFQRLLEQAVANLRGSGQAPPFACEAPGDHP